MARYWWGGQKPEEPTNLTAAATRVAVRQPPSQVLWNGSPWQQEAWAHYDTCPELHAGASIMAQAFSRAKMIAVDVDPATGALGTEPTSNATALALVAQLFGGPTGQAQAQRQIGLHLTVPGECWVLASDQRPDIDGRSWRILSVNEVTRAGSMIQIQQLDGTMRTLQDDELLFRMWQPHPKRAWEADSPVRALLPVFRELSGLSSQINAAIKSRLATGGFWAIPQSAQLPIPKDEAGIDIPGEWNQGDLWAQFLTDAIITGISNPDSAAAIAPIIAILPDEAVKAIGNPIKFAQEILTDVQPLREANIKRIAVGLDMPPEMLLGLGDSNHWSAWQIDEGFVRGPLSSALSLPADAITENYFRVGLRLAGENPDAFAVAYDVNDLTPDANEANAQHAYDAGEISSEAYLRALRFDPKRDAATDDERLRRLVLASLARGNPDTLAELGPTIKRIFPGLQLAPNPTPGGSTTIDAAPGQPAIEAPSTTVTRQPPPRPAGPPDNTPTGP